MGQMSRPWDICQRAGRRISKGFYNPTERMKDQARFWFGGANSWDVISPYSAAQNGDNVGVAGPAAIRARPRSERRRRTIRKWTVGWTWQTSRIICSSTFMAIPGIGHRITGAHIAKGSLRENFGSRSGTLNSAMGLGDDVVTSNNITNPNEWATRTLISAHNRWKSRCCFGS